MKALDSSQEYAVMQPLFQNVLGSKLRIGVGPTQMVCQTGLELFQYSFSVVCPNFWGVNSFVCISSPYLFRVRHNYSRTTCLNCLPIYESLHDPSQQVFPLKVDMERMTACWVPCESEERTCRKTMARCRSSATIVSTAARFGNQLMRLCHWFECSYLCHETCVFRKQSKSRPAGKPRGFPKTKDISRQWHRPHGIRWQQQLQSQQPA